MKKHKEPLLPGLIEIMMTAPPEFIETATETADAAGRLVWRSAAYPAKGDPTRQTAQFILSHL